MKNEQQKLKVIVLNIGKKFNVLLINLSIFYSIVVLYLLYNSMDLIVVKLYSKHFKSLKPFNI